MGCFSEVKGSVFVVLTRLRAHCFFVRHSESGFKALNYPTKDTIPEHPTGLITPLVFIT
jgi:hypothetical protein